MTTLALLTWLIAAQNLPSTRLPASDGKTYALSDVKGWTVVVFFSRTCPVQRSHDARLIALARDFEPRGVAFWAVDAQVSATAERATTDAQNRGYGFPLVADPQGAWADALGARFSTTVVVLDASGKIRYRGGLDSGRAKIAPDDTPYARHALELLLAGQDAVPFETKAMGCVLQRP